MTHLIDKDALVAWIKRRMDENRGKQTLPQYFGMVEEELNILYFLDTLEVKGVQEEPVSEDLKEAAKKYAQEAYSHPIDRNVGKADFIAGAKWQIAKLMANATEVTVHIDAGNYPYIPQMELYDYDKDVPLAKEGDKYKVVLIKEE